MATLTYQTTTIELPDDFLLSDEFAWDKVVQKVDYSLTGALIVQNAARLAGRTFTLSGDDTHAWVPRATVVALRALADTPGAVLSLTLRGVTRSVMFRNHEPPSVEASPVVAYSDDTPADWYVVTLKFMEV